MILTAMKAMSAGTIFKEYHSQRLIEQLICMAKLFGLAGGKTDVFLKILV
jgi:hypothetical protein